MVKSEAVDMAAANKNNTGGDPVISIKGKKKKVIINVQSKTPPDPILKPIVRYKTLSKNKHKLALQKLEKAFPASINLKNPRPLCIGFRKLLLSIEDKPVSNKTVRLGLYFYCNSYQYLPCIVEGARRIAVNGRPRGVVTADEELSAKMKYEKMTQGHNKE